MIDWSNKDVWAIVFFKLLGGRCSRANRERVIELAILGLEYKKKLEERNDKR